VSRYEPAVTGEAKADDGGEQDHKEHHCRPPENSSQDQLVKQGSHTSGDQRAHRGEDQGHG